MRPILVLIFLLALSSMGRAQTKAFTEFDGAIASLADDIAKYVKGDAATGNAIIIPDDAVRGTGGAGPRISKAIREALDGKLQVIRFNGYKLDGNYSHGTNDRGEFIILINVDILDAAGNVAHSIPKRIKSENEIAIELFGATVDATKKQNRKETTLLALGTAPAADARTAASTDTQHVDNQVAQAIQKPESSTIAITKPKTNQNEAPKQKFDSVVRFADDSPYGVELVKENIGTGELTDVCEVQLERGTAFTELNVFDVFGIRIHNGDRSDVGVSVTVDGINTFEFCEQPAFKDLGKFVCEGDKTCDIKGWYIHQEKPLKKFTMVNQGEGAAAKVNRPEGIGVITVIFFETQVPGPNDVAKDIPDVSVGIGEDIAHEGRTKPTVFGNMLGSVSIRYINGGHPDDLPE